MKRFKLNSVIALSLSGFILTSPLHVEAKINIDDLYEKAYEELEEGKRIVNKETRIKNDGIPTIEKELIYYNEDIKLGDIVEVNGSGNSHADGNGNKSIEFNGEALAVVGIKSDSLYPYALASVNTEGKVGHIVGWFKEDSIKSRYVCVIYKEYADAIKEIISSEGMIEQIGMKYLNDENRYIPEYAPSFYAGLKGYHLYDNEHMIKISFDFPTPEREFDSEHRLRFDDKVETREYIKDGEYFYYYYNWETGEIIHKEKMRDTVSCDIKTLGRKFNIVNEIKTYE